MEDNGLRLDGEQLVVVGGGPGGEQGRRRVGDDEGGAVGQHQRSAAPSVNGKCFTPLKVDEILIQLKSMIQ